MQRTPASLLTILFQDDALVAVEKPAGLAVIPGRAETDSVLERLGRQLNFPVTGEADPRLRVVHRLDKDTSGVMLFAKSIEAQRHLSHQFQNNTVEKEYLALVAGKADSEHGEINVPLGPHPTVKERRTVLKHGGRPAKTRWTVEARFRGFTLLRVFPKTGKTHQIRVHLNHIGLPLAIDSIYNASGTEALYLSDFKRGYRPDKSGDERPLIARLTLHAYSIKVVHPTGTDMIFTSAVPKDFRVTLAQLGKHAV